MAIGSFSGLASGVQWRDLIDQIIASKSGPINRLRAQQDEVGAKKTAWSAYGTKVAALQTAAAGLANASRLRTMITSVENSSATAAALRASASASADTGSYRVDVLALAQAEKLGGASFASRSDAAAISGAVLVNGRELTVSASDSLDQIARRFNDLNTGSDPSEVVASVLATGQGTYRLMLTSVTRGAAGIELKDVGGTVLRDLGLVDAATVRKNVLSDGARSDAFTGTDTAVGELLSLTTSPADTVTIGGQAFAIDLATDSLDDIAARIDGVGGLGAEVVADTEDGVTRYRLHVTGTTSFTDAGGVLETLGLVTGTRTAQAQQVRSAAFTTGGAATPALTTTALLDLDSGLALDDTVRLVGARADGTTYSVELTVAADTTMQDVLDALNSTAGVKADPDYPLRPGATATLDDSGRILVTDDAAGDSALAFEITASSSTGALRDLGSSTTVTTGRTRVLTVGSDAVIRVDGAYVTRTSNDISDAITGVNLSLAALGTVNVNVARDTNSSVAAINAFVNGYNDLSTFVDAQLTPPALGKAAEALYGDATLRAVQGALKASLQSVLAAGIAGSYTRLSDLGIEIDRYGKFTVNQTTLTAAVKDRPSDLERFFGTTGTSPNTLLSYTGSVAASVPGTYDVAITTAAARAQLTGSAFGAYVQEGLTDTLEVTDLGTGRTYSVGLTTGMTAGAVADALNTVFGTTTTRKLQSAGALGGATSDTLLTALVVDGAPAGLAADSVLTISGKLANGTAFTSDYTVGDHTLGELLSAIRTRLGVDATVSLTDGRIVVQAAAAGTSQIELSVAEDGTALFGAMAVAVQGRPIARITAAATGAGALTLAHADYGTANGFTVAYSGTATLDALGIAGTHTGGDVAGTIDGVAATGAGRTLTGADGTDAEGLALSYAGTGAATTTMTFSRGIAALVEAAAGNITEIGTGKIDTMKTSLDERLQVLSERADTLEDRLEVRRQDLIRQFTAMEQAMARAQSQSAWLTAQMAGFDRSKT